MKKTLLTSVIAAAVAFTFLPTNPLEAARTKRWTWKRYKIEFRLPSHWKVTKNTRRSFIAKGDGVVMKIGPSRNRRGTAKAVARRALRTYGVIYSKRVRRKAYIKSGGTGMYRYIIFGRAKYKLRRPRGYRGKPVTFGIIGLNSKKGYSNMYVRFYWFSRSSKARKNSRNTYKIAKSFKMLRRYR